MRLEFACPHERGRGHNRLRSRRVYSRRKSRFVESNSFPATARVLRPGIVCVCVCETAETVAVNKRDVKYYNNVRGINQMFYFQPLFFPPMTMSYSYENRPGATGFRRKPRTCVFFCCAHATEVSGKKKEKYPKTRRTRSRNRAAVRRAHRRNIPCTPDSVRWRRTDSGRSCGRAGRRTRVFVCAFETDFTEFSWRFPAERDLQPYKYHKYDRPLHYYTGTGTYVVKICVCDTLCTHAPAAQGIEVERGTMRRTIATIARCAWRLCYTQ